MYITTKIPGACGPDGRCLTCGKKGDTAGCPTCRNGAVVYSSITFVPDASQSTLSCGHGRTGGLCPHCMGIR